MSALDIDWSSKGLFRSRRGFAECVCFGSAQSGERSGGDVIEARHSAFQFWQRAFGGVVEHGVTGLFNPFDDAMAEKLAELLHLEETWGP